MLTRNRILFEAPIDAGGAMPPADPAAGAPAPDLETPAAWGGPSQDEWESTQATLSQIAEFVQAQQQPPQQPGYGYQEPQGPQIPDPFADNYAEQLEAWFQAKVAPIEQFQQAMQFEEGRERAMDVLADLGATGGEFDRENALRIANELHVQKYGGDPRQAERALQEAAQIQRGFEQQLRDKAIEQYQNELAGLGNAPREPGAAAGNGAQTIPTGGLGPGPLAVTSKLFGGPRG